MRCALLVALTACGKHASDTAVSKAPAQLIVSATLPGAGVGELANTIGAQLELAALGVDGIAAIHTRTAASGVTVTIDLEAGTNVESTAQSLNERITETRHHLSVETSISTVRIAAQRGAVLRFTLAGNAPAVDLRRVFDRSFGDLATIVDVGEIAVCGGASPRVDVVIDPNRMQARSITVDDVVGELRAHPLDTKRSLRDQLDSVPAIRDVAELVAASVHASCYARDMVDREAIAVTIYPQPNANLIALRSALEARLVDARRELPPDWHLDVLPRMRPIAIGVPDIEPDALVKLHEALSPQLTPVVIELGGDRRDARIADVHIVPATEAEADRDEHTALAALDRAGFAELDRSQQVVRIACDGYDLARSAGERFAAAIAGRKDLHVAAVLGAHMISTAVLAVDRDAMTSLGIPEHAVTDALRVAQDALVIDGTPPVAVTLHAQAFDPATLATLYVRPASGAPPVPLSRVAAVRTSTQPEVILRENRRPYVDVQLGGYGNEAAIREVLAASALPPACTSTIRPAE